jgi:hypothetical protein
VRLAWAEYGVSKGRPGTTINEENEKLLLSALLRFIALQCPSPRRCAQARCRRSGVCVKIGQTMRATGRQSTPAAPQARRRPRSRPEKLEERLEGKLAG